MLETVRKGMWSPDESVTRELAEIHVELVNRHDAGCSGFVCDNPKLATMISEAVTPEQANAYNRKLERELTVGDQGQQAMLLERETLTRTLMDMARRNVLALAVIAAVVAIFAASYAGTRIRHRGKGEG
jgi:cobaltochelatase CobN